MNSCWTRVSWSWGKGKSPLFAWKGCPYLVKVSLACTMGWRYPPRKENQVKLTQILWRKPQENLPFLLDRVCYLESVWPEIGSSHSGIVPYSLWSLVCSWQPVKVWEKCKQVGSVLLHPVISITAAGLRVEQPLGRRCVRCYNKRTTNNSRKILPW